MPISVIWRLTLAAYKPLLANPTWPIGDYLIGHFYFCGHFFPKAIFRGAFIQWAFSLETIQISVELLGLLFAVAIVAGFVDTLAGGGGLITVPTLILAGVPPIMALGTNKLQGCMGTATSTLVLFRKGKLKWQQVKILMAFAFVGATLGTLVLQVIPAATLNFIVPTVLLLIAVYFIFSSRILMNGREPRMSSETYRRTIVPGIGFYDGFFGPGTGSFFSLAGVALRGQGLLNATATAKALNFATNIASLAVFVVAAKIVWSAGLVMMVGQFIGAWLGAHSLFRIPVQFLRLLIVVVCVAMLTRYGVQMEWFG